VGAISETVRLVDPVVTRTKVARELEQWKENGRPRERGWLLLDYDETIPSVEIAFLTQMAMSAGSVPLQVVACAVRLTYENYDLWPPSLTFIDAVTRQQIKPHVRAIMATPEGPRDVLIDGHPDTNEPFLCVPGIREYHLHPQHTGDDWLLHRSLHEGSISTICERLWRLMARNVLGLRVVLQALPVWPLQAQLAINLTQGEMRDAAPARTENPGRS
jgi:hypothetical protein